MTKESGIFGNGMFPLVASDVLAGIVFLLALAGLLPAAAAPFLFGASWLLFAAPLLAQTFSLLRERRFLDEHFLLFLASLAALLVERCAESVVILIVYRLGRYLQERLLALLTERCRSILAARQVEIASRTTASMFSVEVEKLITEALARKGRPARFATQFAHWYTPLIVFIALAVALSPLFGLGELTLAESVYHAAIFLVLACPAVLLVSIPLVGWATLATLAGRGILVTEESSVETLARAHILVIVMNGILTHGLREVIEILPVEGMSSKRLLSYAAIAEAGSPHPVAEAIREAFGKAIPYGSAEEILGERGGGVVVSYEGREIAVGSATFFRKLGIEPGPEATIGTTVQVALDRFFIGRIVVGDEPRPENKAILARLRKAGFKKIIILSGDNPIIVERLAREAGADRGIGGLSPADKIQTLEQIIAQTPGPVAVAGHAFDDAPLIARADCGIAAGNVPAKRAMEIADIVVTPSGALPLAILAETARKGYAIMRQNLALALWVKGALIVCAALGIAPLWAVLAADTITALILILNTVRIMAGTKKETFSSSMVT